MHIQETEVKSLADMFDEVLNAPDQHLYYGCHKHKEIMARTADMDPEDLSTRAYLVRYLQVYIMETAKAAGLKAHQVFQTTLNDTLDEPITFIGEYVREEFYEPEIEMIRKEKAVFDYTPGFKAAIKKACDLFFKKVIANGWFNQMNSIWDFMSPGERFNAVCKLSDCFDEAAAEAGLPVVPTSIVISSDEDCEIARVARNPFSLTPSPVQMEIRDRFFQDEKTFWAEGVLAIMHEKIHVTTSGMAQEFWAACQNSTANPDRFAFPQDSAIAYFNKNYSLTGGISPIKSIYMSDPEEVICYSEEGTMGYNLFLQMRLDRASAQLPPIPPAPP